MNRMHVMGDSHIGSICTAAKTALKKGDTKIQTFAHPLGGGAVAHDLIVKNFRGQEILNPLIKAGLTLINTIESKFKDIPNENSCLAICIGGYITSLYTWDCRTGTFDLYLADQFSSVNESVMFIPAEVIKSSLSAHFKILSQALGLTKKISPIQVVFVSPPPPYRDNHEIVERMAKKKNAPINLMRQPMNAEIRLKVWKIANEVLMDICSQLSIEFISPDSQCLDKDGFLLPEFYGDGFHANEAYGALMHNKISSIGK